MRKVLLLLMFAIIINLKLIAQTLDVSNSFITNNKEVDFKPLKPINNVPTSDSVLTRFSYPKKLDLYKISIRENIIGDSARIAERIKSLTKMEHKKLDTATTNKITKIIDSLKNELKDKKLKIDSLNQNGENLRLTNIDLEISQLTTEVETAKNEIDGYQTEINKNLTSSVFDNKTLFDYLDSKNQHIIDSMFNVIAAGSIKQSVSLEKDIQPLLDSMNTYYNQIKERRNDVNKYSDKKGDIIEIINADFDKYKNQKQKFLQTKQKFISEFEKYKSVSNDLAQKINIQTQKIKEAKDKNSDSLP
jgi:uncharacterized coiled-coil DUF342 family protein